MEDNIGSTPQRVCGYITAKDSYESAAEAAKQINSVVTESSKNTVVAGIELPSSFEPLKADGDYLSSAVLDGIQVDKLFSQDRDTNISVEGEVIKL